MELTKEILNQLGQPFPDGELDYLPKAQSNGKALGLAYIDSRAVMNRLDAVVGPENWSFDFDVLSGDGKLVRGRLTICGVTKCDAGEANTEEELLKSAVSDAVKRAAVHFGIGRYLYYLPRVWAPYDAQKRRFTETPRHDDRDIRKALALCGVTPDRSVQTAPAQPRQDAPRPNPQAQKAVERAASPQPYPEATGAAQKPAPPQGGGELALESPEGPCPSCHAPAGKPHAWTCDRSPKAGSAQRSGL
jgi:hypothetical protein